MKIELNSGAVVSNIPADLAGKILVLIAEAPAVKTPPPADGQREKSSHPLRKVTSKAGERQRLTDEEKENIRECFLRGDRISGIAKNFNTSIATVYKITADLEREVPENTL